MVSTAPGGYSTESISISFPGGSARSFCMMGATTGCGAAGAGAVSPALAERATVVARIRWYDIAASVGDQTEREIPGSGCGAGAAEPFVEADAAEACLTQRHQRTLFNVPAEVAGVGVAHDGAGVAHSLQVAGDDLVERRAFRAGDLNDPVARRRQRHLGDDGSDVVRRDGLEQAWRNPDRASLRARGGNAGEELEELGRTDDRVGDPGRHDQLLLCDLGAEIAI